MYGRKEYYNMGGPGVNDNFNNQGGNNAGNEQEKAARSVFVGNIPYEATEEQLKAIFTEIGVVLSFRLVYDRETGKPKGYGFCEYQDQETALSAMRNINGRELHGRNLRVDHATRDHGVDPKDLQQSTTRSGIVPPGGVNQATIQSESIYGQSMDPADVPEKISQAIRTLPAEQMYSLMKEMKEVITNNPDEARNILVQNPQLAYALLQATVRTRIVTPDAAVKMLHPVRDIHPEPLETQSAVQPTQPTPPPQPKPTIQPTPSSNQSYEQQPQRHHQQRERQHHHHHQHQSYHQPYQQNAPPHREKPTPPPQSRDPRGSSYRQDRDSRDSRSHHRRSADSDSRPQDREKLALIQQVLQLTPEQINMLPEDQKRSILALKEQIKSQGGRS